MRGFKAVVLLSALIFSAWALGQDPTAVGERPDASEPAVAPPVPGSFDEAIGRIVEREHAFNEQIRRLHPIIETYIQNLKDTDETGPVPVSDRYFLGQLDLAGGGSRDTEQPFALDRGRSVWSKLNVVPKLNELYSMKFLPGGFAQMVLLDQDFQRKDYNFSYVRREFLGEIRCLVIDVHPKKSAGDGRFVGRIWVEDQDFNIVRFNGTYTSHSRLHPYLHFDSWRLNMRPGVWLPAYVYSEESEDERHQGGLHFKAQTRLWGYDLQNSNRNDSFTEIMVDSPQSVRDRSDATQDATPVQSQRMWEREAEDNALERLQKSGLLAPPGEVDQVMQTVVNNLIYTNNLNIQPEVRTRVLLTTPLESFTIGHTIVVSRGLLDVLPDEASLALVLAHELAHIALGHRIDTSLAFNDRLFFPDSQTFERLDFTHDPAQEEAADKKALELLDSSPYKDKLGSAGLFLRSLQAHAEELKSLIRPHLGSGLANGDSIRMSAVLNAAPALELKKTDQIAALPLGARVKLDPWSSRVELVKAKPVALSTFREKMSFEITPFFPYLTRLSSTSADNVAQSAPVK